MQLLGTEKAKNRRAAALAKCGESIEHRLDEFSVDLVACCSECPFCCLGKLCYTTEVLPWPAGYFLSCGCPSNGPQAGHKACFTIWVRGISSVGPKSPLDENSN